MKQSSDYKTEQNLNDNQQQHASQNYQLKNSYLMENTHHSPQLFQKIKDPKYKIMEIPNASEKILTACLSNNLKYFVFGGFSRKLNIWDLETLKLIKKIKIRSVIYICKFTEDSKILYIRDYDQLYKFQVNHQFRKILQMNVQVDFAYNICFIKNNIVLIKSMKTIAKTYKQKQLSRIKAHDGLVMGLEYNKRFNVIVTLDESIKLWNLNDLSLIMQKKNAHNRNEILMKLIFIINNNQLISTDLRSQIKVWGVNYQVKQLELLFTIRENIRNLSLDLEQQFIKILFHQHIKIFTISGEFIRQFNFELYNSILLYRLIQPDSIKAIIINGNEKLFICKIKLD